MEAFGSTIFCDDIRFEQLNKITVVGIYGTELITLGKFPLILPKFGLYISARFPRNHKVEGVKLLMYLPGNSNEAPTYTIDLPWKSDGIMEIPNPAEFPDPSEFYGFNDARILNSVVINQPGYVRVRLSDGENRIKVGALRVREPTAEESVVFQAATPTI